MESCLYSFVSLKLIPVFSPVIYFLLYFISSQFDPAPRDENWHKSSRAPDYFL